MRIAGTLLAAAALLSWPSIAGAPQAAPMPPATTPAGIGSPGAPRLLHLVGDHDHDQDRDRSRHHHHRHHHRHHRHDQDHDQGDHGH